MSALPTPRRARTADVSSIRRLVQPYVDANVLLGKPAVKFYEDVQEFRVIEDEHGVAGCGALHVLWEDLAEIRTIAVDARARGKGLGRALALDLLDLARDLGVRRVFVLTFETAFFGSLGFREIEGSPVAHDVYEELLRSFDEGVAEFLDLEFVKPNTLGNTRMLLDLDAR